MGFLLESSELICKLKDKGIDFVLTSEIEAEHFLNEHNYYVKIGAYRHNYDLENNKYKNLDFFHLKELSTIDMHLKFLVLKTCLNIEHSLKVNLLKDIQEQNLDESKLVSEFFIYLRSKGIDIESELKRKRESERNTGSRYVGRLLEKNMHPNYPIWTLIEVISFGSLVKFIEFYCKKYSGDFADVNLIYRVRDIRNAAAHSNCLIHNLKEQNSYYIELLYNYLSNNLRGYKRYRIKKFIRNDFIHDFCCLILALNFYVKSDEIKKHRLDEFYRFIDGRVIKNKEYFLENNYLRESYRFLKALLDIYKMSWL